MGDWLLDSISWHFTLLRSHSFCRVTLQFFPLEMEGKSLPLDSGAGRHMSWRCKRSQSVPTSRGLGPWQSAHPRQLRADLVGAGRLEPNPDEISGVTPANLQMHEMLMDADRRNACGCTPLGFEGLTQRCNVTSWLVPWSKDCIALQGLSSIKGTTWWKWCFLPPPPPATTPSSLIIVIIRKA